MYFQEDLVPLSALQHYIFCPRQCALNYVDKVWVENYLTASGRMLHKKTEEYFSESRKDVVLEFGMELYSKEFKVFGQADVVEFHYETERKKKLKKIIPVEYKRGKEKDNYSDIVQLCGQALCLQEMSGINVAYGYLFYFSPRKRIKVDFTDKIVLMTEDCIRSVQKLFQAKKLPNAHYSRSCKACSMLEVCRPKTLGAGKSVTRYLGQMKKMEGECK